MADEIRNQFDGVFSALVSGHQFHSPVAGIGVFPSIMNPIRCPASSAVSYSRAKKSISSDFEIPFDAFLAANRAARIDLFCEGVKSCFRQIPERYLPVEDSQYLIENVEKTRIELRRQAGWDEQVSAIVLELAPHFLGVTPFDSSSSVPPVESDELQQIILQWPHDLQLTTDEMRLYEDGSVDDILTLSNHLEGLSYGYYFVDGHDVGSGTVNIFLYTDRQQAALKYLIELVQEEKLPDGVRIGIADPDEGTYRPIYPPELKEFVLFDVTNNSALN